MTNTISELFKKRGIKIDNEKNTLSIPIKDKEKIKTTDVSLSPRRIIY